MAINARLKPARILASTTAEDEFGASVATWEDIGGAMVDAHILAGNALTQMAVRYESTTHVLLTTTRGLVVGMTRIAQGGRTYEPTFVNEDHRRISQVFAKVVS